MSKLFESVEFELGQDPGLPPTPPPEAVFNKALVAEAVASIRQEFERIRNGTSELCHYAVDPGRFANPVGENLKRFEFDPTEKALAGFIQIVTQDLGTKAAIRFLGLLDATKERQNG